MIRSLLIAFTLLCSTSVLAESQTLAQYLNLTGIQMDQVNHAFTKAQEQINNISTDQLSKGVIIDSLRGTWYGYQDF